jgi:hypothetical protein
MFNSYTCFGDGIRGLDPYQLQGNTLGVNISVYGKVVENVTLMTGMFQ